jgi:glycosyltransferase involved in cell wall biosynthesis
VYINDYPDEVDMCSKMKIVCAGRLDKNKNFIGVIRAFSLIESNYENIILEIYGDGPELKNLKNEAEKLNIENQVYFLGVTNNIVEALVGARCFVLFSNQEGYPNILLEAMAVGVPVIASDCPVGACSELIKEGETGLLVSVGSVNELANKIDYILSNLERSKIMAEKARYVRTANHKSIICRSFRDFLEVIVGN